MNIAEFLHQFKLLFDKIQFLHICQWGIQNLQFIVDFIYIVTIINIFGFYLNKNVNKLWIESGITWVTFDCFPVIEKRR